MAKQFTRPFPIGNKPPWWRQLIEPDPRTALMFGSAGPPGGAALARILAAAAAMGYPTAERGLGLFTKGVPAGMRLFQPAPRRMIAQIIPSKDINIAEALKTTNQLLTDLLSKALAAQAVGGPGAQRTVSAGKSVADIIAQIMIHAMEGGRVAERGFNWMGRPSELVRILRTLARR